MIRLRNHKRVTAVRSLLVLAAFAGGFAVWQHGAKGRRADSKRTDRAAPRQAALAWVQRGETLQRTLSRALPAGTSTERVRTRVVEEVAHLPREELASWVDWAARHAPPEYQQALIGALLERWAETDPVAAATRAAALSSVLVSEETIAALYHVLAGPDAPSAARFAASLAPVQFKDAMLTDAIARWAQQDWSGTIDWLAALPDGRAKECGVMALLATADATQCAALVRCVQFASADYAQLQWQLAATWARHDPIRALEWVDTLPAGGAQDRARSLALSSWAARAPFEAAAFAVRLPESAGRDDAVVRVIAAWSQREPATAAQWVDAFADSPLRTRAVAELVSSWTQTEPLLAADWLARMREGPAQEAGIAAFARGLAPTYPALAFRWASVLASPATRYEAEAAIARSWLVADATLARTAMEESDLPRGVKDRLYSSVAMVGREYPGIQFIPLRP